MAGETNSSFFLQQNIFSLTSVVQHIDKITLLSSHTGQQVRCRRWRAVLNSSRAHRALQEESDGRDFRYSC